MVGMEDLRQGIHLVLWDHMPQFLCAACLSWHRADFGVFTGTVGFQDGIWPLSSIPTTPHPP